MNPGYKEENRKLIEENAKKLNIPIEIFNSDKDVYGGYNQYNGLPLQAHEGLCFNHRYKITIKLASFGAMIFKLRRPEKKEEKKVEKLEKVKEKNTNSNMKTKKSK